MGTYFSGFITNKYELTTINPFTDKNAHNWQNIWWVPAYIAIAVLVYFIFFFKEKKELKATTAATPSLQQ
jgi:phosphotransferase system  glucose/maltose/N-acetylglucosamine-specific IIC component